MSSPPPSFEEYVAARWARLVRTAVLLGSDLHTAEDLVQIALSRCYLAWDRVSRADDPDAYVHRVLVNTRLESRRRRWTGERPSDALPDRVAADAGHDDGTRDAIRIALDRLPLDLRRIVVLRYLADLTERQTAEVLGIPLGTVKSRGARAMTLLEHDPDLTELAPGGDR